MMPLIHIIWIKTLKGTIFRIELIEIVGTANFTADVYPYMNNLLPLGGYQATTAVAHVNPFDAAIRHIVSVLPPTDSIVQVENPFGYVLVQKPDEASILQSLGVAVPPTP